MHTAPCIQANTQSEEMSTQTYRHTEPIQAHTEMSYLVKLLSVVPGVGQWQPAGPAPQVLPAAATAAPRQQHTALRHNVTQS